MPVEELESGEKSGSTPGRVRRWFVRPLVAVAMVHLLIVAANFTPLLEQPSADSLFNLDWEATFNAWLSSALLLAIGLLAGLSAYVERAAGHHRRIWVGWTAISGAFVVLSVDETAATHEMAGWFADRYLDIPALPGVYKWVVVVGPVALLFAAWMAYWLITQIGSKSTTSRMALIALVLWVSVLGWEALAANIGAPLWLSAVEESAEVIGEVLMLGAVLVYLADRTPLRFGGTDPEPARG